MPLYYNPTDKKCKSIIGGITDSDVMLAAASNAISGSDKAKSAMAFFIYSFPFGGFFSLNSLDDLLFIGICFVDKETTPKEEYE